MIYILEDDDSIRKLVIYALESQGMAAEGFDTPERFRAALAAKKPELVLLDIMLPHEDGISVLRSMRKYPETAEIPVIMLTAKNTEFDRVTGLDAGADDYIAKPFGMMELVARIRAVLRRTKPKPAITEYRRGTLYVCPEKHIVQVRAAGVVDPAKVTRVALENAASVAGMFLTTECVICDAKEDKPEMPMGGGPGMGGMM